MTTDPTALAKIGEWTSICGDGPEVLVEELAALGFVVARREDVLPPGRAAAVEAALGYFEAAYWKAQASSQADDWLDAALLGKQLACAIRGEA